MDQTVIVHKSGSNLLVRFVWWLLIGWWASGIVVAIAWFALVTIIGIPSGSGSSTSCPRSSRSGREPASGRWVRTPKVAP